MSSRPYLDLAALGLVPGRARQRSFSPHTPREAAARGLFFVLRGCWEAAGLDRSAVEQKHPDKKKPPPKAGVPKAIQECVLVSTLRSFISSRSNTTQTNWHCASWAWCRCSVGTRACGLCCRPCKSGQRRQHGNNAPGSACDVGFRSLSLASLWPWPVVVMPSRRHPIPPP